MAGTLGLQAKRQSVGEDGTVGEDGRNGIGWGMEKRELGQNHSPATLA